MQNCAKLIILIILILAVAIIWVTPYKEANKRAEVVEEEFPIAIIYGEPIYEKMKVVIVNSSKACLPLSNVSVAKTLWPGFGIRIEYEGQVEEGKRFEFRRILTIDASENITSLSIGSGKILGSSNFAELNVKINLVGEGLRESAKIYSEKGYPIAFFWKNNLDERLKLKPGIYRLEVTVSGVPKFSTYSSLQILLDARFSVTPDFLKKDSVVGTLQANGYGVSYRIIGSIGVDDACSVAQGVYVGGFVHTSKFRDAIIIRFNNTEVLWAKIWGTDKDEWVWDVSEGVGCVYSAVSTSKNGVLLELSDEGELLWAKELKLEDVYADTTAVTYGDGYLFVGGNFLAKLDPDKPKVLWCRYPFGLITDMRLFGDFIYVLDNVYLLKLDSQGNLVWVKRIVKDGYVDLKSMYVTPSGIYVLGWINSSTAILMLDHDGNLRWAKLLVQESLPNSLYVDGGNVYIVGGLPKGNSFLAIFNPESDEAQGIVMSGSDLRDVVSFGDAVYCVGATRNQSLEVRSVNYKVSNIDVTVESVNRTFRSCTLGLNDAKGSLKDFAVGRGEGQDILIVKVSLN